MAASGRYARGSVLSALILINLSSHPVSSRWWDFGVFTQSLPLVGLKTRCMIASPAWGSSYLVEV